MVFYDTHHAALVLAAAVLLDLILGDPAHWPHPVRLIGWVIDFYEDFSRRVSVDRRMLRLRGRALGWGLPMLVFALALWAIAVATLIHNFLGTVVSIYIAYSAISLNGLATAVGKVGAALKAGDIHQARRAVSMIVGRDTAELSAPQIAAAAVESGAENASDGVVAPLFYMLLGGPALGLAYKAINTADSMIGYRNERYIDFGRAAARLDDLANWVPARITALLLVLISLWPGLSARGAWRVSRRDARLHASPNAGWPEAAIAGALGISLGGKAEYGGLRHDRPLLGREGGRAQGTHVLIARNLVYATGIAAAVLVVVLA